jgi:pyrroline-5-carboxylate reductase
MRYLKGKRIGIVGLGNMGGAILSGLISSGAVGKAAVAGFDIEPDRRAGAGKRYSILISRSLSELIKRCDIVIIAVKPQNIDEILKEISFCGKDRLYISIAAGSTTKGIEKALGGKPRVVRAMPNTPALVGEGISAICKGRYASRSDIKTAGEIFSSVGEAVELNERYFDVVTALSGSGPAYLFYLIEALIDGAVRLGMDRKTAKRFVFKTALGSARLLIESVCEPGLLRQRVTSKGGTTERAIAVFEEAKIKEVVARAVRAAARRSKELSRG